jgi:hypothetical protein
MANANPTNVSMNTFTTYDKSAKRECRDSIVATGALTQGHAVTYAGATATAGAVVHGFADATVAIGEEVTLVTDAALTPVVAGAGFAASGVALASNGTGRLITAVAGDYVVARSRELSAGNGSIVLVKITHEGTLPA